jgi:TRAP-type C4-dicarboxylate transport system substrate-binding protein
MMDRFKLIGFCAASAVLLTGSAAYAGVTWDMPTAYPATNFQTVNAQEFSQCVATATGGDLTIIIHANGSLFKGNDIKRAVQTGQAQIGERLLSAHENENPIFGTDSIPFLATSYENSVKLYGAARPELDKLLDGQGLMLLYSVPWPPQGLYFKKDVNSVADMAGTKVRSYNKATARLSELTGMVPISIEAAEISQALSAGVISSLITSAVTGQDSKVWEQLDHFYEVKAWMPRNSVIVNKGIFDALTDKEKSAIKDCAAKAEVAGLQKSKDANDAAVDMLKKNGMRVLAPSAAFADEMQKIGTTMTDEWVAKAGDPGKAVIAGFKK